ncbi:MAG: FtsX-like permease family protein [Roseburia sp.]|nr:FtsX-like permease family protein [Roseburia sp.]MCM1099591.1 FtsX-like permease family protein [Ruminococcus flavefaciens]
MNVLQKCCYRSMRENRKRTAVTIIGILLATALVTAVACMAVSFRASMVAHEKAVSGNFHYLFSGVAPEDLKYFESNRNIESFYVAEALGYAALEGCKNEAKPYLYLRGIEEDGAKSMALQLTEGRMPENDEELVIGRHIRSNGGVDLRVGDTLTLEIGNRQSEGYMLYQENPYLEGEESLVPLYTRTYTIVGMINRPHFRLEPYTSPGYSVFTLLDSAATAKELEVYAIYTPEGLKHRQTVTDGLLGREMSGSQESAGERSAGEEQDAAEGWEADGERNTFAIPETTGGSAAGKGQIAREVQENTDVIRWELMHFSDDTMNMLYGMCLIAIVIIIVAAVFCIRNSFVISLTEKVKLYGRLASVGTTAAQQRRIVYYEAGFLAAVGIPPGIAAGLLAAAIIVRVVGSLVEEGLGFGLVFEISVPAILLASLLSLLTVFLSACGSARRAARISPISAIRANETVKPGRKELRCPAIINRLFGVGGKLAYRNLQRAKVKYRTTVVSIVVSVAVFIGVYSFMELATLATGVYYEKSGYQLDVSIFDEDAMEKAEQIIRMEGVEQAEIRRTVYLRVDQGEIPYTEEFCERFYPAEDGESQFCMITLGEEGYENYCRQVGLDPEKTEDRAIVMATYDQVVVENDGKRYYYQGDVARYRTGDVIRLAGREDGSLYQIEVAAQVSEAPMCLRNDAGNMVCLIVSDDWWEANGMSAQAGPRVEVVIRCGDADELEKRIRDEINLLDYYVYNLDEEYRSNKGLELAVAIFLYGFIIVVSLIGVTNIFNTVTTNMELRAPEFAICRSVGMTGREFRRMLWLEGLFYGGKSLLLGIPFGLLISVAFHGALGYSIVSDYRLPWGGILLSAAAVFLLLYCVMRYSMKKAGRKNIVETIQNENI